MDLEKFKQAAIHAKLILKVSEGLGRDRVRHCLDMCDEMVRHYEKGKVEKAMRWLGFVQGFIWAKGFATIEELREVNRKNLIDPP